MTDAGMLWIETGDARAAPAIFPYLGHRTQAELGNAAKRHNWITKGLDNVPNYDASSGSWGIQKSR